QGFLELGMKPGKSLALPGLVASPPAGLAYGLPRKRLPPAAQARLGPATTRSIAVVKKLGQGWAEWVRAPVHGSALRRAIQPQFAPTPSAPVLRLLPVAGLRSRSASGPRPDPSKLDRISND